jgi:hypothetical protein
MAATRGHVRVPCEGTLTMALPHRVATATAAAVTALLGLTA